MALQRYFPTREGDQIGWFTNLNTRFATYNVTLSIDAARQAKTQLVLNWLIWIWQTYIPSRRMEGPAATAYRNNAAYGPISTPTNPNPPAVATLTPPLSTPFFGMLTWLFQEIERWRTSEGYNDDIGQILGIVGAEETGPDLNTITPLLEANAFPSFVRLLWGWLGYAAFLDLCELQVNRGAGWTLLAYDTTPNYDDTYPHPATPTVWKYRGIYRVGDHQVGQWSAEISVTVGG